MLLPWTIGHVSLFRLSRRREKIRSGDQWRMLEQLRKVMGIARPVRLMRGEDESMPMTWGTFAPCILLPTAADRWSLPRLRLILLHELAHVKRYDYLTQSVVGLIRAMEWFNPLVWLGAFQMRVERERACDDLVLTSGSAPGQYADQLLGVVSSLRSRRLQAAAAVAMARRSTLEGRLLSILDTRRKRRAMSRTTWAFALALIGCITLPLATMQATAKLVVRDGPFVTDIADTAAVFQPTASDGGDGRDAKDELPPIVGTVIDQDGLALSGAQVTVVTAAAHLHLNDGLLDNHGRKPIVLTGPTGQFAFTAEQNLFEIVIVHDEKGFSRIAGEAFAQAQPPSVKVEPWGRVSGRALVATQAAAGQTIRIWRSLTRKPDRIEVAFECRATADADGRFIIDTVPPGSAMIGFVVGEGNRMTQVTPTHVYPETNEPITLGGSGRAVIGRIVAPMADESRVYWTMGHQQVHPAAAANRYPDNWPNTTVEQLRKWYDTWQQALKSDTHKSMEDHYGFDVIEDGTFRIDDVRGGDYVLDLHVHESPQPGSWRLGPIIGQVSHPFTVPPMIEGRSDTPLDLGELVLSMYGQLRTGDAAPPFEARTFDGQTLRLEDFQGRFILLEFWASWCPPCAEQVPHLKRVYERFVAGQASPRLAMVSLSVDADADMAQRFIEKHELKWVQGTLGDWSKTPVPNAYGVRGIPALFLIGPDGRIIATKFGGENLEPTIAAALAQAPQ